MEVLFRLIFVAGAAVIGAFLGGWIASQFDAQVFFFTMLGGVIGLTGGAYFVLRG